MPNLESCISAWRKQMLAAGIQSPVPLDELESHLRDEIALQIKSGLAEEAAFETAAQKIGKTPALKTEFAKVHETPAARKLITVFVPLFVLYFSLLIMTPAILKAGTFAELNSRQQISCLAAAAALSIFCWTGLLAYRLFPAISNQHRRNILQSVAVALLVVWWTAFFFLILPNSELTMAQLMVVFSWGFAPPCGILAGFMAGLEKAATTRVSELTPKTGGVSSSPEEREGVI